MRENHPFPCSEVGSYLLHLNTKNKTDTRPPSHTHPAPCPPPTLLSPNRESNLSSDHSVHSRRFKKDKGKGKQNQSSLTPLPTPPKFPLNPTRSHCSTVRVHLQKEKRKASAATVQTNRHEGTGSYPSLGLEFLLRDKAQYTLNYNIFFAIILNKYFHRDFL